MIYVLDTSAILRFLDGKAGVARVDEIIGAHLDGRTVIQVSAMHWGELSGVLYKRAGLFRMRQLLANLETFGFVLVPVTADRATAAALLHRETGLPYVDALGVELAAAASECIFVTADYDFKVAQSFATIEFLSANASTTD